MTAVLINVPVKRCELIASGQKTIVARKAEPRLPVPFRCFIYCSREKPIVYGNGEIFVTDSCSALDANAEKAFEQHSGLSAWNGNVIGEFVCDRIAEIDCDSWAPFDYQTKAYIDNELCFGRKELIAYAGFIRPFGWHISNLIMYDKPKSLDNFTLPEYVYEQKRIPGRKLKRAPASWCYVES